MRGKVVGASLTLITLFMTAAPLAHEKADEDLQKQIDELKQRVQTLERQLQSNPTSREISRTPRASTRASGTAATPRNAGRDEALALYHKVDGLMATGNLRQAHREVSEYNDRHAGTSAAGWTRSLSRELEVVGKDVPQDWSLEKWFQGQDDIVLDGSRRTLLVFWESWCPHCRDQVPEMQKLYEAYKDRGLQVLGVTRITKTATEESVRAFLEEHGISFPVAKETGDLATYFNVKGIPAAALVENGKIVWRGHPIRLTDELMGIWY